jgi:hypothetical protein
MASRELLEWLGITFADLLTYLAAAAVTATYFLSDATPNIALAVLGVGLSLAACPLGMKPEPRVSGFTNGVKLVAYPVCVLLVVGAIVVRYTWFNR